MLWPIEVPLTLDCGGYVAMKRQDGYRWSIFDCIDLAIMLRPVWWAAQDCRYRQPQDYQFCFKLMEDHVIPTREPPWY